MHFWNINLKLELGTEIFMDDFFHLFTPQLRDQARSKANRITALMPFSFRESRLKITRNMILSLKQLQTNIGEDN